MARGDLSSLDSKLDQLKAESKGCMGRLRDEEQLKEELLQKKTMLEEQVRKLSEQETHLKGHSNHLEQLQLQSKERQYHLNEEKKAVEALIATLTEQNGALLQEMDSHTYAHEVVRTHLDRKEEVKHLMSTFNRDLIESKMTLERYVSPLR